MTPKIHQKVRQKNYLNNKFNSRQIVFIPPDDKTTYESDEDYQFIIIKNLVNKEFSDYFFEYIFYNLENNGPDSHFKSLNLGSGIFKTYNDKVVNDLGIPINKIFFLNLMDLFEIDKDFIKKISLVRSKFKLPNINKNNDKIKKIIKTNFNVWRNVLSKENIDILINYIATNNKGPIIEGLSNKDYDVLIKGYLACYYSNLKECFNVVEINERLKKIINNFSKKELREYKNILIMVTDQIFSFNLGYRYKEGLTDHGFINLRKERERYLKLIRNSKKLGKIITMSY